MSNFGFRQFSAVLFGLLSALLLGGCYLGQWRTPLPPRAVSPYPTSIRIPTVETTPSSSSITVFPWTDESATMSGICFEAALDAAGQVYVFRSAEEHIDFYDLADNSRLCRRPVQRYPFDFTGGRVLAGLWSAGVGCTARHDVLAIERNDDAKTFTVRLRFVTEGDCPYELVRPFWMGLDDMADYEIDIVVE